MSETQNVLQLPVFFFFFCFFCESYPGLWKCKSVFLILKILQYGTSKLWVQGVHVRIDMRIDISVSIRFITNKFCKQVHLHFDSNETNQPGVRDVITSSLSDKLKTYLQYQCRQISQDGNLPWCTPADYVTWQFDHADLYDRLTYYNHYISSITVPMVPKLGKIVT